MTARLYLKSGLNIAVQNLKIIKKPGSGDGLVEEIKDFSSFFLYAGKYSFVGDTIVSVDGNDLLLVSFED